MHSKIYNWLIRNTPGSGFRKVNSFPVILASEIGIVRKDNQDKVVAFQINNKTNKIFSIILCDGMGGMINGAECAALTISSFIMSIYYSNKKFISEKAIDAVKTANSAVFKRHNGRGGSTLSAILFDCNNNLVGINVGDSRIYSLERQKINKITIDDTIAEHISNKEEFDYTRKNELLQYIGIGDSIEPHLIKINKNYDSLLLTSDGLHFVGAEILNRIFISASEKNVIAKRLTELSKWLGGQDNASISIIDTMHSPFDSNEDFSIQIWDPFSEFFICLNGTSENKNVISGNKSSPTPKKKKTNKVKTQNENEQKFNIEENSDNKDTKQKNEQIRLEIEIS
jgi:serine/threonine protein phosphatase PrpC